MSSVSQQGGLSPRFIYTVVIPVALVGFIAYEIWMWLQRNGAMIAPWAIGVGVLLVAVGLTWAGWRVRKVLLDHKRTDDVRRLESELLEQQVLAMKEQVIAKQKHNLIAGETHGLIQDARTNMDNVDIKYSSDGAIEALKVIRSTPPTPLQGTHQPLQLSAAIDDVTKIPTAPKFLDMCHLITTEKAPLCFDVSGPVYGTVLDLLSMAVSGKPGRGKTTALMYYVAFLLRCGAEVWIFDPHGTMGELAKLNGQVLKNMPATAKVIYLDRQQDMVNAVPVLMADLADRDELYRPAHAVKHPLLVLADELPVIAEYDADIIQDWKAEAKEDRTARPLTFARLFKKFVLEARKWVCYFIGSGQTFDAETLPKKITDSLNSRIVFFSSDMRARMSGLENDAIKTLLPAIRRAGAGVMVFDCSRFDTPIIGAIPYITVDDLMIYLGVTIVEVGTGNTGQFIGRFSQSLRNNVTVTSMPDLSPNRRSTDSLQDRPEMDVNDDESMAPTVEIAVPDTDPTLEILGPDDKQFLPDQAEEFLRRWNKKPRAVKEILREMNNGVGLSNRYSKHASLLLKENGFVK